MPYVKPVTFVTATSLNAADVNSNDDALREWINEGSVSGDLAAFSFVTYEKFLKVCQIYLLKIPLDSKVLR